MVTAFKISLDLDEKTLVELDKEHSEEGEGYKVAFMCLKFKGQVCCFETEEDLIKAMEAVNFGGEI